MNLVIKVIVIIIMMFILRDIPRTIHSDCEKVREVERVLPLKVCILCNISALYDGAVLL